MDFIEIEIIQWDKHQPRKDIKHPTWFALSNRVLEDAKLFDLTDGEWKALLYIFCQASQQNSAKVRLSFAHAKRVCEIPEKTLRTAIDKLAYAGVTSAYAIRTDTLRDTTLQTDTTDRQNTTNTAVVRGRTPDPTSINSTDELLEIIPEKIRGGWPKLYPDPDYVPREAVKAIGWCATNKTKVPKSVRGWSQFFNGWLERGWDKHRKTISSNPADINRDLSHLPFEESAS